MLAQSKNHKNAEVGGRCRALAGRAAFFRRRPFAQTYTIDSLEEYHIYREIHKAPCTRDQGCTAGQCKGGACEMVVRGPTNTITDPQDKHTHKHIHKRNAMRASTTLFPAHTAYCHITLHIHDRCACCKQNTRGLLHDARGRRPPKIKRQDTVAHPFSSGSEATPSQNCPHLPPRINTTSILSIHHGTYIYCARGKGRRDIFGASVAQDIRAMQTTNDDAVDARCVSENPKSRTPAMKVQKRAYSFPLRP